MTRLVLAGNAVTAQILLSYLDKDSRYEVAGLTVDDEYVGAGLEGNPCVGLSGLQAAFAPETHRILMAMGYNDLNRSREAMFHRLKAMGYAIEAYVHPDARVYTDQPLGEGCIILPGAVVEPCARIGANTMVWSNVTVAHHAAVAENCWLAAGTVLSGQARVERNCFLGVNSTVVNEVTVAEYNIIGACALVSKNTKPRTVHISRSAEPLRYSADDYILYFGV